MSKLNHIAAQAKAGLSRMLPEFTRSWQGGTINIASHAIDVLLDRVELLEAAIAELALIPVDTIGSEDTVRLDWLEAQGANGLQWQARPSTTNRGFRLHQDPSSGQPTARAALDEGIAKFARCARIAA